MASGDENNPISVSEYLRELKSNISTWEDIVIKSQRLNFNLKNVGPSVNNVVDCIGLLCESSRYKVAGVDKVTQLLSEITVLERYISEKVCIFNKAVQDNLVTNLSQQIETWRKSVATIMKERDIDGRKAKVEYKKSLGEVTKLDKKINKRSDKKQSLSDTISLQADYASQDLQNKERFVEDLERCVLRKAICEERSRYRHLLEGLRPVLEAQLSMRDDLDRLQRVYDELYSTPLNDLSVVPPDIESYVREYHVSEHSRSNSFCSVYSRANSQLSLGGGGSSRSSITEETLLHHLHNLPSYCPPENLDTSSSTLHDTTNDYDRQLDLDTIEPLSDDDDEQGSCSTDLDTIITHTTNSNTTLYPNQALPAPRYSNLRQLKQNAEKKYGMSTLSRDLLLPSQTVDRTLVRNLPSHYADRTICHNLPSHYSDLSLSSNYSEHTFFRELSTNNYSNHILPSHYSDSTLTRNSNHTTKDLNKDNDVYSTMSQIYGTTSLFADVNSGTSTFKRRKPSNVTAMDAPVITDKRFFDPVSTEDTVRRNMRSISTDRDKYSSRHSVDLSQYPGYVSDKIIHRTNFCSSGSNDNMAPRAPLSRKESRCRESVPLTGKSNDGVDSSIFKQQLLHVIQTGRAPYNSKPLSPVLSHMF